MDDSRIIELFFERSEQAIDELSQKYGRVFSKLAFGILNNEYDVEECLDDAYLAVWNTIPPQNPERLLSFVCRIVRNLAIKRRQADTAQKRNGEYDVALDEIADCFPSSSTVEDEIDSREIARAVDRFLETLDRESRVMFVRRYWYSASIDELAEQFKMSRHNVSVRLSRIRGRLKKYLKKEGVSL